MNEQSGEIILSNPLFTVGREVLPSTLPDRDHVVLHLKSINGKHYRQFSYLLSRYESQEDVASIENWAIDSMAESLSSE